MKNRIKKDIVKAMKEKNVPVRDILRVLKGEIERNEQSKDGKIELSDAEIVKLVKKLIESTLETGDYAGDEIETLKSYLPQQMTSDQMKSQAQDFIFFEKLDSPRDMGKVMAYFKKNHEGTYDGGELSKIVRQLLN